MSDFQLAVHQNEYLHDGASEVHAIVTVSSGGVRVAEAPTRRLIVIMGDFSGSMNDPIDPDNPNSTLRIVAAKKALAAAVSQLPDGTEFAVIAGSDIAVNLYPGGRFIAKASDETRASAISTIHATKPGGGTAMSKWLDLARQMFESASEAVCQGILITDGKNESESAKLLEKAVEKSRGKFTCDCRGVGVNWKVNELRLISEALLGDLDMVRSPEAMVDDFQQLINRASSKTSSAVKLRVWTPKGAELVYVKQVSPSLQDLTTSGLPINELSREFPTGSWGPEERDYHVCIRVVPGQVGDEMLAARVSVLDGSEVVGQSLVRAIWTEDSTLSTRVAPEVAHYTGQAEMAQAIQAGLAARASGDERTATIKLGEAVRLAHDAGHTGTVKLLEKIVDVDDPKTGTVRLKMNSSTGDEMELDTRSTKTVRVKKS